MKKVKRPSFRVVLIGLVVLYAVLIAVGLLIFRGYLQRYEQNHPAGAMDAYFAALHSGKTEKILADSDFPFDAINTKDAYIDYLNERYRAGDGQWQYALKEESDGRLVYDVYESNQKYGSLTLEKAEKGGYRVFSDWEFGAETTFVSPVEPFVNGVSLSAYREGEPVTASEFEGLSGTLPTLSTYRVKTLLPPEVTLQNGVSPVLTTLKDGSVQVTAPVSAADTATLTAFAEKAARTYACYISNDAEYSELQALLESNTPFTRWVRAYDRKWYNQHRSVEFQNMKVEPPVAWSEEYFTVDVSFDFVVSRTYDSSTFKTAYHIACRRAGDGFRVVNITPL